MRKFNIILLSIFILFVFCCTGFCDWKGPIKIISGEWGTEEGKFGRGDSQQEGDMFPNRFFINDQGDIYIVDCINSVIYKFNQKGQLIKSIRKPKSAKFWVLEYPIDHTEQSVYFNFNGGFMFNTYDFHWLFFDKNGDFIIEKKILAGDWPFVYNGYFFPDREGETYSHYSINGEFLGKYNKTQLNNMKRIGEGGPITTTNLHREADWPFFMEQRKPFAFQVMHNHKKLSAILPTLCNDQKIDFEFPKTKVLPKRPSVFKDSVGYENWKPEIYEVYEIPTISIDDDLYCIRYQRYVKEEFSIIKWVWTDGPDTPYDLMAKTSEKAISLTWRKPVENPETVTKYEIYRSTEVCGPYNLLSKVENNVNQFIDKDIENGIDYYYKMCAIRNKTRSGYSDKAKGGLK